MKRRYFFLSKNPDLSYLKPRVPDNFFTRKGYEDNTTKRVCLSRKIEGCLAAMSQNLENTIWQVYMTEINDANIHVPSVEEVPDSAITGEVWCLKPVKLHPLKKIRVTSAIDKPQGFTYGNGQFYAETYFWNYDILN